MANLRPHTQKNTILLSIQIFPQKMMDAECGMNINMNLMVKTDVSKRINSMKLCGRLAGCCCGMFREIWHDKGLGPGWFESCGFFTAENVFVRNTTWNLWQMRCRNKPQSIEPQRWTQPYHDFMTLIVFIARHGWPADIWNWIVRDCYCRWPMAIGGNGSAFFIPTGCQKKHKWHDALTENHGISKKISNATSTETSWIPCPSIVSSVSHPPRTQIKATLENEKTSRTYVKQGPGEPKNDNASNQTGIKHPTSVDKTTMTFHDWLAAPLSSPPCHQL